MLPFAEAFHCFSGLLLTLLKIMAMKYSFIINLLIGLGLLTFTSCKKTADSQNVGSVPFAKLAVNQQFNWASTKTINVKISGIDGANVVRRALLISSNAGSGVLYRGSYAMNENVTIPLTIPAAQDSIYLKLGNLQKSYAVAAVVDANFLPNLSNEAE